MKYCAKTIVAALMLLMISAGASAQTKLFHFGVKAGLNMSSLDPAREGYSYKDNLGYQAGIALQFDLPMWFSVEPDILFSLNSSNDPTEKFKDKNGNLRSQGLASLLVPINLQWGPKFADENVRVFLQASPFLGYAISKDFRGEIVDSKEGTRKTFDWENFNRFQYGYSVGLGVKAFAFQVTAEYYMNLNTFTNDMGSRNNEINKIFDGNFSGFRVNLAIIF